MRGTPRRGDGEEGGGGGGGSGGHSPRGADATEDPQHVARIYASPGESLLKIFAVARGEKKNTRKNRGRESNGETEKGRERERELSYPAVLIWPSERDDTREATRRRSWNDFVRASERLYFWIVVPSFATVRRYRLFVKSSRFSVSTRLFSRKARAPRRYSRLLP